MKAGGQAGGAAGGLHAACRARDSGTEEAMAE